MLFWGEFQTSVTLCVKKDWRSLCSAGLLSNFLWCFCSVLYMACHSVLCIIYGGTCIPRSYPLYGVCTSGLRAVGIPHRVGPGAPEPF